MMLENIKTFLASSTIISAEQAQAITYMGAEGLSLVDAIIALKYGSLDLLYDPTGDNFITDVQADANTVFQMHAYNWSKKYATIQLTYDAITTVKTLETGTDSDTGSDTESGTDTASNNTTNSGSDSTSGSGTNTGTVVDAGNHSNTTGDTNTTVHKRNNFDASGMVTNDEDDVTDSSTDSGTDGNTRTNNLQNSDQSQISYGKRVGVSDSKTYGHVLDKSNTLTYTHNRSGYEGSAPQDLIQKEREIAEYNFYEMIADELVTFLCDLTYQF